MTSNEAKRAAAAKRARAIYDRLMTIPKPEGFSNNEWTERAGVNTSFFTNLKNGSEPTIGNLRAVLEAISITLPEFFAYEANGRLVHLPNAPALERAFLEALPGLPKRADKRPQYLAEVVLAVLELPDDLPARPAKQGLADPAESSSTRRARVTTK